MLYTAISILKCQEATFLHQLVTPGDVPDESGACFHHWEMATHVSQVSLNYSTIFEAGVNVHR